MPKLFVATKAFIEHEGKILVLKESPKYEDSTNAGLFDIVGGRLTPGENFEEALHREVMEETGLVVEIIEPFFVNEWRPHVRGEDWHIVGIFFRCVSQSDAIKLSQDHDDYKWIDPQKYKEEHLIPNLEKSFQQYIKKYCS